MRISIPASFLSLTILLSACAAGPPVARFTDSDRNAIATVTAEALDIANSSADWEAYTELYYADDAFIHMEGGATVQGRPAIVNMLKQFTGVHDFRIHALTVDGSGDLAYVYGESSFMPPEGATPERYRYIEVWKRQADGTWKVVQDIGNRIVPGETPTAS